MNTHISLKVRIPTWLGVKNDRQKARDRKHTTQWIKIIYQGSGIENTHFIG